MTSRVSIEERVRTILNHRLQVDSADCNEDLFQTGILDSLSFVDMLLGLEEEFSIHVALDTVDLDDFRSVSRISDYIQSQDNFVDKVAVVQH
jgi:acyl carrier protein